jgi:DNA mismatch repair ATPase MutS
MGAIQPTSERGKDSDQALQIHLETKTGNPIMTFHSILFEKDNLQKERADQPEFFPDLNLDQVINAIAESKKEYNLKPFFYNHLRDAETIYYRHDVMRDLEDENLMTRIKTFSEKMVVVRRYLGMAEKLDSHYHKLGWILESALDYCEAVNHLLHDLEQVELKSRGLLAFREYVTNHVHSQAFQTLQKEAQKVKGGLSGVKYSVIIQQGRFSVQKYEGETDYSVDVVRAFEKFKQGAANNYLSDLYKGSGMNHIEAKILEFVALLYPKPFAALDQFCANHSQFIDDTIRVFDREIQFYIAYLDFIADVKYKGLNFCYPQVGASREVYDYDGFDLALAHALTLTEKTVVCNDFCLKDPERIIVVSGPNQGGKTTFARTFGQLHYLASLGCPVPGREARLFLFDQIYAHFERQEDIRNLRGKLEDDVARIHDILVHATSDSILIMNEIFASTTLQDAVFLSKEIMTRIMELDTLCVWVTFIDELSSLSEKTISMVSTVMPENPATRTFKIVRQPADGLAYALSLAEKHRLTYRQIKERIQA